MGDRIFCEAKSECYNLVLNQCSD